MAFENIEQPTRFSHEPSTLERQFPHLRKSEYDPVNLPTRVEGERQDRPPIKLSNLIMPVIGLGVHVSGKIRGLFRNQPPASGPTSSPAADTSPKVP